MSSTALASKVFSSVNVDESWGLNYVSFSSIFGNAAGVSSAHCSFSSLSDSTTVINETDVQLLCMFEQ
jgi:hypothetical protein